MLIDRRVVGQQLEHPLDVTERRRRHRDRQSEAFCAGDRVAVAQNSAMFCAVTCTGSPLRISRVMLSTAAR